MARISRHSEKIRLTLKGTSMKKDYISVDEMSPKQKECWDFLCDVFGGSHHVNATPFRCGEGIAINRYGSMATFDFQLLTRAVIFAHDRLIRLEISAASREYLRLTCYKREKRDGKFYESHPSIESAIAFNRKSA